MNTTKTEWNTGRSYTSEGQVIRAIFTPTEIADGNDHVIGSIDFADISRNISGRFERVCFLNDGWENEDGTYPELVVTEKDLQKETLRRYDEGGYDSSQLFDAFGNEKETDTTLNVVIPDPHYLGGASTRVLTADTPRELSIAVRKWITESGYGASDIGALFNVYRDDAMVATVRYNARFDWNDSALADGSK